MYLQNVYLSSMQWQRQSHSDRIVTPQNGSRLFLFQTQTSRITFRTFLPNIDSTRITSIAPAIIRRIGELLSVIVGETDAWFVAPWKWRPHREEPNNTDFVARERISHNLDQLDWISPYYNTGHEMRTFEHLRDNPQMTSVLLQLVHLRCSHFD